MCCENCELERTNPELYKLKMRWLDNAQCEEFHQKQGNGYMFSFHKENRLELEKQMKQTA
jgi:hypothetical protein